MGKKKDKAHKKDKASKSNRKKYKQESVEQALYEDTGYTEPDSENIQVAEYVTVGEMMDLINTLNQGLEQRAKAAEQLQQQIKYTQNTVRSQYKVLRAISITAIIGIIAVGYFAAKPDSAIDERIDNISTDTVRMSSQIKTIDTNMQAINNEINKVNNGLKTMSTDISTTNQNIDKLTSDVNKINADSANRTNETPYRGYTVDPRSYWR